MNPWICDGIPKDGKQYPNCSGEHEPYENFGTDCVMCGLPQEAALPKKTTISSAGLPVVPILMGLIALLLTGGIGFLAYQFLFVKKDNPPTPVANESTQTSVNPGDLISQGASHSQFISQGEKILLDRAPEKEAGATQFSGKNWDKAITEYQNAVAANANDPESRIYLNNAKAQKVGNPLTIAIAVPISESPNSAKEILRGVAQAQEEFNQSASGNLLEVVIVNYGDALKASAIAEDVAKASNVLGVLGYGVDAASNQALKVYQQQNITVLSPLTTSVKQSILTVIPSNQKNSELLDSYVQAVGTTLTAYASKQNANPSTVIFYNSDSSYSLQLKQSFVNALPGVQGKVVKEVDISNPGFNAQTEIANAKNGGANTIFLALSKNKVNSAIAITQANQASGSLVVLAGDELYNPDTLVQGGDSVSKLVLSVPWSFQSGNSFAETAKQSWKGRVSWRTATAYDAMKTLAETVRQNPSRTGVTQKFNQGVPITGNATNFQVFQSVPLVIAVKGNSGPPGSQYQFDPLP